MDRRAVVAGLVALLAIACGGPADDLGAGAGSGGSSGASGEDDSRIDEGVIDGLLDPSLGDASETDAATHSEPDATPDGDVDEPDAGGDGDGDSDASITPCSDADGDDICDDEDTCPVGVEAKCDAILWTIELPSGTYEVAPNTRSVHFGLMLEAQGESLSIVFEMAADGTAQSFDFDSSDLAALRNFVGQAVPTLRGRVVMSTLGDTVVPVMSENSVCSVDPRMMVVRRVAVVGSMTAAGSGSVEIAVRGYVEQ